MQTQNITAFNPDAQSFTPTPVKKVPEPPKKTEEEIKIEKRMTELNADDQKDLLKIFYSITGTGKESKEPTPLSEDILKDFVNLVKPRESAEDKSSLVQIKHSVALREEPVAKPLSEF